MDLIHLLFILFNFSYCDYLLIIETVCKGKDVKPSYVDIPLRFKVESSAIFLFSSVHCLLFFINFEPMHTEKKFYLGIANFLVI